MAIRGAMILTQAIPLLTLLLHFATTSIVLQASGMEMVTLRNVKMGCTVYLVVSAVHAHVMEATYKPCTHTKRHSS